MTDLGVIFRPQFPVDRLRASAQVADAAGVDELWLWEDCFDHGGISTATAALAFTERLRVGVGVLPVPLRNVALTAMEVATLARLFPGRVEIGVGHGVQDWMAQVGAKVASPMTLLREYTVALRALLAGERVDADGRYVRLAGVALGGARLDRPPRISLGAVGPKTVALAGEVGDGLVLTGGSTPDDVRERRAAFEAARGDRPGRVTAFVVAVPGAQRAYAAELMRWGLDGDPDDLGVWGEPARIAEGIGRWIEAGADAIVLQPPADADPIGYARWAGEQVRPLLG